MVRNQSVGTKKKHREYLTFRSGSKLFCQAADCSVAHQTFRSHIKPSGRASNFSASGEPASIAQIASHSLPPCADPQSAKQKEPKTGDMLLMYHLPKPVSVYVARTQFLLPLSTSGVEASLLLPPSLAYLIFPPFYLISVYISLRGGCT